jgi:hypothetical protein
MVLEIITNKINNTKIAPVLAKTFPAPAVYAILQLLLSSSVITFYAGRGASEWVPDSG